MTPALRFRAWTHRHGQGLTPHGQRDGHELAWCPTHDVCRGHTYRRDLWAIDRATRRPAPYRLQRTPDPIHYQARQAVLHLLIGDHRGAHRAWHYARAMTRLARLTRALSR